MAKKSAYRLRSEEQARRSVEEIKNSNYPEWAKEYLIRIYDPAGKVFRAGYRSFAKGKTESELVAEEISRKYNISTEEIEDMRMAYLAFKMYGFDLERYCLTTS